MSSSQEPNKIISGNLLGGLNHQEILDNGFVPLIVLAEKYGYAKDHIGSLARTGRLEAIRYGKYGQWYAKEGSLKRYQSELAESQKKRIDIYVQSVKKPTVTKLVLFPILSPNPDEEKQNRESAEALAKADQPVLYNDQSSLSAEAEELITKRINTVLVTLVLLGGIFVFAYASPKTFDAIADTTKDAVQLAVNKIRDFGDISKKLATDLFDFNQKGNTPKQSPIAISSPTPQLPTAEKIVTKEIKETVQRIEREITITQKLDAKELADIFLAISETKLRLDNVENRTTNVPTIIQLPPSNTKGVGNITLNPQKVDTETLSVSSSATLSSLTVDNNATISGNLTVTGASSLTGSSSISASFELTSSSSRLGINSGNTTNTMFEVGGTASISGALTLNNITYTFPSTQTANKFLQTDGSGTLSWATAGVSSNSLDFDEFVDTMLLDADLTINRGGYKIGIGSSPSTVFEVQGTASASYLLTGNTLQVGGFASAAYSRFGTSTTGHANYISTIDDLLISGDLEVDGSISAQFASASRMFITNPTASASLSFRGNGSGGANQSLFSIGVGNGTERLDIFNNDNSPFVTIASTGNVGIGTTTPGTTLAVNGDVAIGFDGPSILGATRTLALKGSTQPRFEFIGTRTADDAIGGITFINNPSGVTYNQLATILALRTDADNSGALAFHTGNAGTIAEKMRIDKSGNVGIGTTGPTGLLHMNRADTTRIDFNIENDDSLANDEFAALRFLAVDSAANHGQLYAQIIGVIDDPTSTSEDGRIHFETMQAGSAAVAMAIDGGNVGIGTAAPSAKLTVEGSSPKGYNSTASLVHFQGASDWTSPQPTFMVFDNSNVAAGLGGSIGFGGAQNASQVYQGVQIGGRKENATADNFGMNFVIWTRSTSNAFAERMRVQHDGNVGIGTTNPSSHTLQVTGSAGKTVGGTAWADLSDSRLKNIQGEVKGTALDTLMQLRPIKFKWNDTHQQLYGGSTDNLMYGFVAQEIMEVIPEFVKEGGDGYFWYNPSGIEAILTAGVQEQQGQMASLSKQFYVTDMRDMTNFLQIRDIVASQSRDMNRDIASLSFRIEDLEQKITSQSQNMLTSEVNTSLTSDVSVSTSDVLNLIVSKFNEMLGVVFEKGLLKVAQIFTDKIVAKEVCIEEVCINKEQLKALLETQNISTPNQSAEADGTGQASEVAGTEQNVVTSDVDISPTSDVTESEPTPQPSPEATAGEAEPTPEPTLEPSTTPEVTPEP